MPRWHSTSYQVVTTRSGLPQTHGSVCSHQRVCFILPMFIALLSLLLCSSVHGRMHIPLTDTSYEKAATTSPQVFTHTHFPDGPTPTSAAFRLPRPRDTTDVWLQTLRFTPSERQNDFPLDTTHSDIPYRMFSPNKNGPPSSNNSAFQFPLVLYLNHGGVRRNFDNLLLPHPPGNAYGLGLLLHNETQQKWPHYVLAPYSGPAGWTEKRLALVMEFIDELCRQHPINRSRIYVMGQSMGAIGTFSAIRLFPHTFAAAIPICGLMAPLEARSQSLSIDNTEQRMSSTLSASVQNTTLPTPVWAFIGQDDVLIPPRDTRRAVDTLRTVSGAWVALWEYVGADHEDVSELATLEPMLLPWLFDHALHTPPDNNDIK